MSSDSSSSSKGRAKGDREDDEDDSRVNVIVVVIRRTQGIHEGPCYKAMGQMDNAQAEFGKLTEICHGLAVTEMAKAELEAIEKAK